MGIRVHYLKDEVRNKGRNAPMAAPTRYRVTDPNGRVRVKLLTAEHAKAMRERGFSVESEQRPSGRQTASSSSQAKKS